MIRPAAGKRDFLLQAAKKYVIFFWTPAANMRNQLFFPCGKRYCMKLTIVKKLLAAYLLMALLTILAGSYALFSLQHLNELAYTILKRDFLIIYHGRQMLDSLLAQERSEKKYIILKDPALEELYRARSTAVKEGIKKLQKLSDPALAAQLARIRLLHNECDALFQRETALIQSGQADEAARLSEGTVKQKIEALAAQLRDLQKQAEADVDQKMNRIRSRGTSAATVTTVLFLISLGGGVGLALFVTYAISLPLRKLKTATGFIADGNFDYDDLKIDRQDEIGELARRFRVMAGRLKLLEQLNLDASPLTRLPGNIAIEQQIEQRLAGKQPFTLCHADLDNFKPFADKYGYAWASEIIKEVADILLGARKTSGRESDFVGHIGGDDFVIITEPGRAEDICRQVVAEFDRRITRFYEDGDREAGYIMGKDRRGTLQHFPLMTISIGVVTGDGSRFDSPLTMARTAADLKEFAKATPVSNYVKLEDVQKH
jgi:GGDEF domain-containing protein/CHASE3 domain sensor protein